MTRGAETLVSANGGNAGTGYFKSGTAVGGTGNGHGGGLRANGTAGVGYIFDDETLGLAGGGGGGGCSSGSASQIYSGAPFGARGSYAGTDGWTEYHAGIAGIGGGGGGGNGNSNTYATGSKGGNGAVYLRVHY